MDFQNERAGAGARLFAAMAAATVASLSLYVPAQAAGPKFTTLYAFCQEANCTDGMNPYTAPPFLVASGVIYGTTERGGDNNIGTFYQLTPKHGKYTFKRIYSFCVDPPYCTDGGYPIGHLIQDTKGNLYGVAGYGSRIFELSPNADRSKWTEKVVFNFVDIANQGIFPAGGLTYKGMTDGKPYDGKSPLYGMTTAGGTTNDGVVYRLTPGGDQWTEDVLYTFCQKDNCNDGSSPGLAALLLDGKGDLYGTTQFGGANGKGVVFKLSGSGSSWKETVLYNFCSQELCPDGQNPNSGLVADSKGDLFGTTLSTPKNGGVVYRVHPARKAKYDVLDAVCDDVCDDGDTFWAPVTIDKSGNIFALANHGGTGVGFGGTLIELVHKGKKYQPTVLYNFCSQTGCADGQTPLAPVVIDSKGALYGTTNVGGSGGGGIVFRLQP